jgi:hypothetical protein
MGSVWRARQTEPVKRFVAIKLIKAGMDSKQVLARFDAERQALALMDHPNIARRPAPAQPVDGRLERRHHQHRRRQQLHLAGQHERHNAHEQSWRHWLSGTV